MKCGRLMALSATRETAPCASLRLRLFLGLLILGLFRFGSLDTFRHGFCKVEHRAPLENLVEREHNLEATIHGIHGIFSQAVAQARADDATDVLSGDDISTFEGDERL